MTRQSTPQQVKRACDNCHRRKVKCTSEVPCKPCFNNQLGCTYNTVPQKKGPKGSRAHIIMDIREKERQNSFFTKVHSRMSQSCDGPPQPTQRISKNLGITELAKECGSFFSTHVYHKLPIIDDHSLNAQIALMGQDSVAYCLATAMSAFVLLQPGMTMPSNDFYNFDITSSATVISSQLLIEEAITTRANSDYIHPVEYSTVLASYFLYACHYTMQMHEKACFFLREAATLAVLLEMNHENHYAQLSPLEAAHHRRLYWLLYSVERLHALRSGLPLTLKPTINPPTPADPANLLTSHHLDTFNLFVKLYSLFEDSLIADWNTMLSHLNTARISHLEEKLQISTFGSVDANFTDLPSIKQWLEKLVWQCHAGPNSVNPPGGFLNNNSRDLLSRMARSFPSDGMKLVSPGLIEKLIKITLFAVDFLSIQFPSRDLFFVDPSASLLGQILAVVGFARIRNYRFLPLLMTKLSSFLVAVINPGLMNPPDSVKTLDMFDDFGNTGMMQMSPVHNNCVTPESANSHMNRTPSGSSSVLKSPFSASPNAVYSYQPDSMTGLVGAVSGSMSSHADGHVNNSIHTGSTMNAGNTVNAGTTTNTGNTMVMPHPQQMPQQQMPQQQTSHQQMTQPHQYFSMQVNNFGNMTTDFDVMTALNQ